MYDGKTIVNNWYYNSDGTLNIQDGTTLDNGGAIG